MTLETDYIAAIVAGDTVTADRIGAELDAQSAADVARLERQGALASAAMYYARHGVAVFPCKPRDKVPATAHGFKDASTDPAQIREWWTANPAFNIGAPTGRLFDVVDLDGPDAIRVIYGGEGVELPPAIGLSLTSRDAGRHIFIAPTGAGNRANIYPHVDYRGDGGYVVLPPSVGANGRRYRWLRPLSVEAAA